MGYIANGGKTMIDKMKVACFSGHRNLPQDSAELQANLEKAIIELIERGVVFFGNGGAVGFDALAATAVLTLKENYPDREFHLIIGSDNWQIFPRWYQSERIIAENHLLVYPRPGYPVSSDSLPANVRMVSSPVFEISSTFIRQALEEGKDVRYFLHPAVYEALSAEVLHGPNGNHCSG